MSDSLLRVFGIFLMGAALLSCGGGGGSGADSAAGGGGELVTLDTTSVDLGSRYEDGPATIGQDIHLKVDTSRIVDFYIESVDAPFPSWLGISLGGSGSNFSLTFVASTAAPVGDHHLTLRLVGLNPELTPVATRLITVHHEVLARLKATTLAPLTFDFVTQAPSVAAQSISISATGLDWTAATGTTRFQLSSSSGNGSATVSVQADNSLLPGSYNDTITINSSNGQVVQLPVSAVVRSPSFVVTPTSVIFSAINGSPIASQSVAFSLDNSATVPFSASSTAAWLGVTPTSGTTPSSLTLSIDATQGPLATGTHSAAASLSATGVATKSVPVSLALSTPTLTAPASVTLGGTTGRDFSTRSLTLSLNTQTTAWPWTLTSKPDWVSVSASSGTVNASGTTLTLTPVPGQATPGTQTGTLSFSSTINGDTVTRDVSVTFNLDTHRLIASATGVALSDTPSASRLTRTLQVSDNYGATTAWTASSDQSWLTVTSAGTTGASATALQLSADASTLATNTLHYATVTISSTDASIAAPETVRIALWKGDTTPATLVQVAMVQKSLVADPIRPYVYVHNNSSSIDVYHLYTGAKVTTMASLGAALGDMAVSGDGKWLYVTDTTNAKVVVVDLATQTKSTSWSLQGSASTSTFMVWTRSNGVPLLFLSNGTAYLASTGTYLRTTGIGGALAPAYDGRYMYSYASKYLTDYSDVAGGTLAITAQPYNGADAGGNPTDVAIARDGNFHYVASGSPYACIKNNAQTMSYIGLMPEGAAYPNNIESSWDGRVLCAANYGSDAADLWLYNEDSAVLARYKLGTSITPREVVFSGDSLFVAGLVASPWGLSNLSLVWIGQ